VARGYVRPLQPGDIAFVAEHMREADREEVVALRGPVDDMNEVLSGYVLLSTAAWTVVGRDRAPIGIVGISPLSLLGGRGCPWMLGTDQIFRNPGTLVREGRRYVGYMLRYFPHLVNYVDARNTDSVRWLRHLGFTVHEPAPHGAAKLPFHRFEMKA